MSGAPIVLVGGQILLFNALERGTDYDTRLGRQITMKNLQMTLNFEGNEAYIAASGPQNVRCLLIYDKQCNGVAPTLLNVLVTATAFSLRNLNYRNRFRVIMDKVYNIDGVSRLEFTKKYYINLRSRITTYNEGDDGDVGDISTGSLYMLFISDCAADGPTVRYHARLKFFDN